MVKWQLEVVSKRQRSSDPASTSDLPIEGEDIAQTTHSSNSIVEEFDLLIAGAVMWSDLGINPTLLVVMWQHS